MKRQIATLFLGVSLIGGGAIMTGCASLFPSLTETQALTYATDVVVAAQFADGLAVDAWQVAQQYIPPSNLAAAVAKFNLAQDVYHNTIQAMEDAIAGVQDATAPNPDWPALVLKVQDAVAAIVKILADVGVVTPPGGKVGLMSPQFATHFSSVQSAQAALNRYH